jgi:pyruvate dehydrogenase E2 component (dihydrolipoamide acetyltransferase)
MSMASKNIQLPELGEGVTEGELVKWLVKPGDKIEADQTVAEMMTDKATVEVPSPTAGIVKELKLKEGDVVEVGNTMLVIDTEGASVEPAKEEAPAKKEAPAAAAAGKSQPAAAAAASKQAPAPAATQKTNGNVQQAAPQQHAGQQGDIHPPVADAKVLATPATRRLAREMGVDINGVSGSGVAGRVTREDVQSGGAGATAAGTPSVGQGVGHIARPAYNSPAGAQEERVAIRGIRKKIAESMQLSKSVIPHITLADEANITELVNLREGLKAQSEKLGVKITYLPFVMKAMIATIREFPMFNASIDDQKQEIVYKKYFNIGFAADTPNGLVVPVIKNADQKTTVQIAKEINELGKKARDGKLALEDMKGATITVTNIGSFGGTFATPIINHPEVAILGMYKISEKPVIKRGPNGEIDIDVQKTMNFTITADHRLIDGAVAIRFLQAFIARIEKPGMLMLDMI